MEIKNVIGDISPEVSEARAFIRANKEEVWST